MEMVLYKNSVNIMWTKFKKIDDEYIRILKCLEKDILSLNLKFEKRHFNKNGKLFFKNFRGMFYLKKLLNNLKGDFLDQYEHPIIDHAFLLIKSPGGNKTLPHQDYFYWSKKETKKLPSSMITFWLSINDINSNNGALCFKKDDYTNSLSEFNTHTDELHIHNFVGESHNKSFQARITPKEFKKLVPISTQKGEWILFDAYSIHCSTDNLSKRHRIAMKMVIGERGKLVYNNEQIDINFLCSKNKIKSFFYIIFKLSIFSLKQFKKETKIYISYLLNIFSKK